MFCSFNMFLFIYNKNGTHAYHFYYHLYSNLKAQHRINISQALVYLIIFGLCFL